MIEVFDVNLLIFFTNIKLIKNISINNTYLLLNGYNRNLVKAFQQFKTNNSNTLKIFN